MMPGNEEAPPFSYYDVPGTNERFVLHDSPRPPFPVDELTYRAPSLPFNDFVKIILPPQFMRPAKRRTSSSEKQKLKQEIVEENKGDSEGHSLEKLSVEETYELLQKTKSESSHHL